MPGTVAGSQPLVSTDVFDSAAPSPSAQSSMVSRQPDSRGTLPSWATSRRGAFPWWVPQSVQPVAAGRWPSAVPYTSKPLRPSGSGLERFCEVMRTQRARVGRGSWMFTTPPVPAVVRYAVVQDLLSSEVSTAKTSA